MMCEMPQVQEAPKPQAPVMPEELKAKCIAKAKELRRKYPHMKPDRIKRKVAEYFKITLT